MKSKIAISLLALTMASCQIGPIYYDLPAVENLNRDDVHFRGNHVIPGCAYRNGTRGCFIAKDLTDKELDDCYPYPGVGYDDSKWCGSNPNEIELSKLHLIETEDGEIFLWEDVTDELWKYEPCYKM